MPTLKTQLMTLLTADAALGATLTGGVYDAAALPVTGAAPGDLPGGVLASDGVTIRPFAVLRWTGGDPFGADVLGAEARTLSIFFYAQAAIGPIDTAQTRVKALLHDTPIAADDVGLAWCIWRGDLGEQSADEYGGAVMSRSLYEIRCTRA
jgi:hypothetical protein